jgi:hypothetical protein
MKAWGHGQVEASNLLHIDGHNFGVPGCGNSHVYDAGVVCLGSALRDDPNSNQLWTNPPSRIQDCNGVCVDSRRLGDGWCDSGAHGATLNCDRLECDDGDCDVDGMCSKSKPKCGPGQWQCGASAGNTCVEGKVRCNGVADCPDGRAEGCVAKEPTGGVAADGVETTCTLIPASASLNVALDSASLVVTAGSCAVATGSGTCTHQTELKASDEDTCDATKFYCETDPLHPIDIRLKSNGDLDCIDGSDEPANKKSFDSFLYNLESMNCRASLPMCDEHLATIETSCAATILDVDMDGNGIRDGCDPTQWGQGWPAGGKAKRYDNCNPGCGNLACDYDQGDCPVRTTHFLDQSQRSCYALHYLTRCSPQSPGRRPAAHKSRSATIASRSRVVDGAAHNRAHRGFGYTPLSRRMDRF